MLQMYTDNPAGVAIAAGGDFVFQSKNMQTNGTSTGSAGSALASLNAPGFYRVHFDGVVSGTAADVATISLYVDGSQYISGSTSLTFDTTGSRVGVGFETFVYVGAGCPYANFDKVVKVVTDTALTMYHANLTVTRV